MKKALFFISLSLFFFPQGSPALEKRSSDKRCTICHIRWLDAFTRGEKTLVELKETGIVVSGTLSDVTTRQMCYSCHDGYVADSRIWMASENKHHAMKKVPEGFHLPEGFRLNTNNEFYCGTCHGFHDVEAEGRIGEVPFVRLPNKHSQMCLACHPDQGEVLKIRNHPVGIELKSPLPSGPLATHAKFGAGRQVICESCHAAHSPAVTLASTADSRLCLSCHAEKQSTEKTRNGGPFLHPVNEKQDRNLEQVVAQFSGAKLGAGGRLICATCHSTHEGVGQHVLVWTDGSTFCEKCHTKEAEAVSGTKHNLSRAAPGSRNTRGQSPEQSGSCGACHLAHGRAQELPQGADPLSGACLSCHREGGWAGKETVGAFSHPVGVAMARDELKTDLPLKTLGGEQRIVCTTCHDAHRFWPGEQKPIPPLDVDGDPTNSFLRMEANGLCRECHPEQQVLRNTKHNLELFEKPSEEVIERKLTLGGLCMGCHHAHEGQARMMWFRPLRGPTGAFDREEATRRCLSCHSDPSMKSIQEERGHPVGREIEARYMPQPPERFELGKLETPSGEQRVLICTTCHIPHGARIADETVSLFAGGGLQRQELCIACHGPNRQVIGSPHDFRTRKPGAYIPDEGRSQTHGACAGCHANHNSRMDEKLLWFQVPAPKGKGNPEDMLCLYCHMDPRIKSDRTKFYAHPRGTEVREILKERLREGEITSEEMAEKLETVSLFGYESIFSVRCVTCHDNHRWFGSGTTGEATEKVNTELTSFLRGSTVAQKICSRCHGLEALYRYRFFHQDRVFRLKIPNE